jgi:hypothetical protein
MERKIENRNIDVTKARGELEEDLLEYLNNCFQFSFIKSKEAFNFSPKGRFTYIAILGFCDSMFFSIW